MIKNAAFTSDGIEYPILNRDAFEDVSSMFWYE